MRDTAASVLGKRRSRKWELSTLCPRRRAAAGLNGSAVQKVAMRHDAKGSALAFGGP